MHDLGSGATTQVTTDPDYDENPFWSPDGRRLLYQSRTDSGLLVVTIDGSAPVLSVGAESHADRWPVHAGWPHRDLLRGSPPGTTTIWRLSASLIRKPSLR